MSDEAKQHAKEVLANEFNIGDGGKKHDGGENDGGKDPANVARGLKAYVLPKNKVLEDLTDNFSKSNPQSQRQ